MLSISLTMLSVSHWVLHRSVSCITLCRESQVKVAWWLMVSSFTSHRGLVSTLHSAGGIQSDIRGEIILGLYRSHLIPPNLTSIWSKTPFPPSISPQFFLKNCLIFPPYPAPWNVNLLYPCLTVEYSIRQQYNIQFIQIKNIHRHIFHISISFNVFPQFSL